MSAANWRRAMGSGSGRGAMGGSSAPTVQRPDVASMRPAMDGGWIWNRLRHIRARHLIVLAVLIAYPWFATPFFTYQIGGQALVLGLVALSLMFLAGYGGMVSLAQMTVAGIAGYVVAILGVSGTAEISLGWPWWVVIPIAVLIATLIGTAVGWLSVRTEGIYTIMITLAIGVGFYFLVLQNYSVFNGFQGFQRVYAPEAFGIEWRRPMPFYYLALACALAGYFWVKYIARSPFGIVLQGIRDNPRRMRALGFNVVAHRVAAYAIAGLIAAVGGVLLVWYNGLIAPSSVGTNWLINILIIAIVGGLRHPIGPFLGAIVFVLLQNFAIDVFARERFNLVIGLGFLIIVLFSRDGLLGWWAYVRRYVQFPSLSSGLSHSRTQSRIQPERSK